MYTDHTLEIRDANLIEKVVEKRQSIDFNDDDIKGGFPKLYLKDDDVVLLNSDRIELFGFKHRVWKLNKNTSRSSQGDRDIQKVTDVKILSTIKFFEAS